MNMSTGMQTFWDSRQCGGITIAGFQLVPDAQGFVVAPTQYAEQLAAHGFVRQDRPVPQQKK